MPVENVEQQITPDATQAAPPEELHPVAAAFGGNIGEALEKGGDQIASRLESLSLHLSRMNYYRQEAQRADILNQYKTAFQNKLYGNPQNPGETVTQIGGQIIPKNVSLEPGQAPSDTAPAGQPIEVPAAVYNRQGYAASGALQDVDDWHHATADQIIQQAQGLGLRNLGILKSQMDSAWSSERNMIAKHEATQVDQAQQKTFFQGMQLDADNAVTKQDPISLGRTIDSINQQNQTLNDSQGKDKNDPIRDLNSNKFITQALSNSMTANLKNNGGDPTQFKAILDNLHDNGKINDDVYTNISDRLDKNAEAITKQNDIVAKTAVVNNRINLIGNAVGGKLDLSNPNTINEISSQDPKLGEAIDNYNLNKNDNIKDEDSTFADATEKIFNSGSKEEISKYAMQILKEGNISQDRLNILMGAAMDRGKNLADLEGQSKASNPIQNAIDGGLKAIMNWGKETGLGDAGTITDFLGGVKNKPVAEAHDDAITNTIIRNHPAVASMSTPPNMVITKDNDIKYIFPKTNRKEEDGTDNTDK